jgi:hypothetical protein
MKSILLAVCAALLLTLATAVPAQAKDGSRGFGGRGYSGYGFGGRGYSGYGFSGRGYSGYGFGGFPYFGGHSYFGGFQGWR